MLKVLKKILKLFIELSKQNYKELMDYVRFNLIKCVDNSVLRYPGEIVNYIDITISKKILQILIENIFNKSYEYNDNMKEKKKLYVGIINLCFYMKKKVIVETAK